jgi:hypothetical protein
VIPRGREAIPYILGIYTGLSPAAIKDIKIFNAGQNLYDTGRVYAVIELQ